MYASFHHFCNFVLCCVFLCSSCVLQAKTYSITVNARCCVCKMLLVCEQHVSHTRCILFVGIVIIYCCYTFYRVNVRRTTMCSDLFTFCGFVVSQHVQILYIYYQLQKSIVVWRDKQFACDFGAKVKILEYSNDNGK